MFDAKALAGQIVLDGGSLSDVASHDFADSTEAFFHRGYTAVDADHLAALWQEPTHDPVGESRRGSDAAGR